MDSGTWHLLLLALLILINRVYLSWPQARSSLLGLIVMQSTDVSVITYLNLRIFTGQVPMPGFDPQLGHYVNLLFTGMLIFHMVHNMLAYNRARASEES